MPIAQLIGLLANRVTAKYDFSSIKNQVKQDGGDIEHSARNS
jgi:hypothetical protein